jgi:hypothetical protein
MLVALAVGLSVILTSHLAGAVAVFRLLLRPIVPVETGDSNGHNCSAFPPEKTAQSRRWRKEAPDTRLRMMNPEPSRGISRAVRSLAPDTGRYQHSACTITEIYRKGDIFVLCTNPSCPNKGANWALQEELT